MEGLAAPLVLARGLRESVGEEDALKVTEALPVGSGEGLPEREALAQPLAVGEADGQRDGGALTHAEGVKEGLPEALGDGESVTDADEDAQSDAVV
jgi:hypothetical protein